MSGYFDSTRRYQYRIHQPRQTLRDKREKYIAELAVLNNKRSEDDAVMNTNEDRFDIVLALLDAGLEPVVEAIVLLLRTEDLSAFQRTCAEWNSLINDRLRRHWRIRLKRKIKNDPGLEKVISEVRAAKDVSPVSAKADLSTIVQLETSWRRHEPLSTRIEFNSFVLSLAVNERGGGNVFLGLNNGSVEEWNNNDGEYHRQIAIECHQKGVKCLALAQVGGRSTVLTGSYDSKIRVWDWDSSPIIPQCIGTLVHHSEAVWEIRVVGRRAVSCGMDGVVAVFGLEPDFALDFLIKTESEVASAVDFWLFLFLFSFLLLFPHELFLPSLLDKNKNKFSEDIVVAGCDNATIQVWDAANGSEIHKMKGKGTHSGYLLSAVLTFWISMCAKSNGRVFPQNVQNPGAKAVYV